MVLKCYKFAFDLSSFTKNIGRIFMTIILFLFLILLFIFLVKERKNIDFFINLVMKNKNSNEKKIIKNKNGIKENKKRNNITKNKNNNLNSIIFSYRII